MQEKILITGGAGFIGSALVRYLVEKTNYHIVIVDKLTYAGNTEAIKQAIENHKCVFEQIDITNSNALHQIFNKYKPTKVMHLAAESHVDNSILSPKTFIETNVIGTFELLEIARHYYNDLEQNIKNQFRFLHISTDEVFGMLGDQGAFTEKTPYNPSSPYSATKAASDHLVRAWHHTYKLPTLITNCSNNYGSWQYPEKLIPVVILNALRNKNIPVYGEGLNVRDWLYVDDHVRALLAVLEKGQVGETYNIGGHGERKNIDVVKTICSILDELCPKADGSKYNKQINFVTDRVGHDWRYAIDCSKIERELNWKALETFETGIYKTVKWYTENIDWCEKMEQKRSKQ